MIDDRKESRSDKRPSFQFYPDDWMTDEALRFCSLAARGLWMDMLCMMHAARPYGHLKTPQNVQITEEKLAKYLGIRRTSVLKLVHELEENKVFSRMADGTIFSRRMTHDQLVREKWRENGSKGGRPKDEPKDNPNGNPIHNQKPRSSSSPSSSPQTAALGFETKSEPNRTQRDRYSPGVRRGSDGWYLGTEIVECDHCGPIQDHDHHLKCHHCLRIFEPKENYGNSHRCP